MTGRNIFYPQWNGILEQPNAWITNEANKSSFDNNLTDAEKRKSRMREKRKYVDFIFLNQSQSRHYFQD
jgi:hypothetical protein